MTAWVYTTAWGGDRGVMGLRRSTPPYNPAINFGMNGYADGTPAANVGNATAVAASISTTKIFPSNTWIHLACSYNAADGYARLWTNGTAITLTAGTTASAGITNLTDQSYAFYVGREGSFTTRVFPGTIDDARLYTNLALDVTSGPSLILSTLVYFTQKPNLNQEIGF
jgi:hypothetical protein